MKAAVKADVVVGKESLTTYNERIATASAAKKVRLEEERVRPSFSLANWAQGKTATLSKDARVEEEKKQPLKPVPKAVSKPPPTVSKADAGVQVASRRNDYMAIKSWSPHSSDSEGVSAFKTFRREIIAEKDAFKVALARVEDEVRSLKASHVVSPGD